MGEKEYFKFLDPEATVRIRYRLTSSGRKLTQVVVQLEVCVEDEWFAVVRYDNAHGFMHRDELDPAGRETKTGLTLPDLESFALYAEHDFKDRAEWFCERFVTALRRRRSR